MTFWMLTRFIHWTRITFFLLSNTIEGILKYAGNQPISDSVWSENNSTGTKTSSCYTEEEKKQVIQVWNDMSVSKLWLF